LRTKAPINPASRQDHAGEVFAVSDGPVNQRRLG